jgi:PadR family transcriptional regulator PadR
MAVSGTGFLRHLRRELRHGVLPVWILEELAAGPTYGYALLERLRARHGADLPVGPSALYPALARLRTARLVRSFHGTDSRGPVRKYYELTPQGWAMLPAALEMTSRFRPSAAPVEGRTSAFAGGTPT